MTFFFFCVCVCLPFLQIWKCKSVCLIVKRTQPLCFLKWPADGQPSSARLPILGGSLQGLQGQGGAFLERIIVSTCCLWAVAAMHKNIANVPLQQLVSRGGSVEWYWVLSIRKSNWTDHTCPCPALTLQEASESLRSKSTKSRPCSPCSHQHPHL